MHCPRQQGIPSITDLTPHRTCHPALRRGTHTLALQAHTLAPIVKRGDDERNEEPERTSSMGGQATLCHVHVTCYTHPPRTPHTAVDGGAYEVREAYATHAYDCAPSEPSKAHASHLRAAAMTFACRTLQVFGETKQSVGFR